jgi:hypothetical protein
MKRIWRVFTIGFLASLLGIAIPASADVVYDYTGTPFTSASGAYSNALGESITGTITFATALTPNTTYNYISNSEIVSWDLTVDGQTWTSSDSTLLTLGSGSNIFTTDASGNINTWDFAFDATGGSLGVQWTDSGGVSETAYPYLYISSAYDDLLVANYGDNVEYYNRASSSSAGSWSLDTSSAATPEPSSFLLLGTGLAGFAGMLKRRFAAGDRA